ncbi:MAG: DNA-binding transcriptional MerR regulator [Flavobacteriaceae bacterium]|jgi:DNA-binding transcriptional MerR regulator|uniref:MerR family transcriptional regulator n=1 Tax=Candidatus Marifrigoribacter sp. Uisw_064 TaxID=3230970 RepID=UPI003AE3189C
MNVKTQFSIKDLENLSGVKAHTIRIWEKRYNLLEPSRSDTNIRSYDLENLKKLLNVTFLYNAGFKISKIAELSEDNVLKIIQEQSENKKEEHAIKLFKTAMFDFDYQLFSKTYRDLLEYKSFREVFFDIFLPLLNEVGTLWHTGTLDPSHERFISELIKQKIIVETEKVQDDKKNEPQVFTLYLPYEEIHEIGLLYANYELLSAGFKTIYLGTNIPLNSLKYIIKHHSRMTFISYFTVKPDKESVTEYIDRFENEIHKFSSSDLWVLGSKIQNAIVPKTKVNVQFILSLQDLIHKIENLKNNNILIK